MRLSAADIQRYRDQDRKEGSGREAAALPPPLPSALSPDEERTSLRRQEAAEAVASIRSIVDELGGLEFEVPTPSPDVGVSEDVVRKVLFRERVLQMGSEAGYRCVNSDGHPQWGPGKWELSGEVFGLGRFGDTSVVFLRDEMKGLIAYAEVPASRAEGVEVGDRASISVGKYSGYGLVPTLESYTRPGKELDRGFTRDDDYPWER